MGLTFIYQDALWLLLLLPALWALTLAAPRRFAPWRLYTSLVLRSLIIVALVFAVGGVQLMRPVGAVTTVFLLDASDSVPLAQRARAEAFVQDALAAMPPDDRAAIVSFGQRAAIERSPSESRELGALSARPGGGATNIEEAVQLGLTLLPAEGHQRLVLLSDGGQTSGDALAAARLAAAQGVPLDVVPLDGGAEGLDALISGVELPATAREGQRLPLRVTAESSAATPARLSVTGPDGEEILAQEVQLSPGVQVLEVTLPEAPAAFNRYVVRLEAPGDTRGQNDVAETYSFVTGRPRVLLVEGQPGEAAALERALGAAQVEVQTVAPDATPATLADLSAFDTVVLVNVPQRAMRESTAAALESFVEGLGHGLVMVGGPESFGAGSWRGTPVEETLPVTMDIPPRVRLPPTSVTVLIDISGSMAEEENGRTKLSLAVEGAQRIASLLRDEDELTVIPFDNRERFVVGPIEGSRRDEAIEALNRVELGGGGINIRDGLTAAAGYVRRSDRPVRHIITLTDGDDTTQQDGALDIVRALGREQVTLSSIAIGDGDHIQFIKDMARTGDGRYFFTDRASTLPDILVDEAQSVIQPYIVEGQFTPDLGQPHPALRGLDATPPLEGYVTTTPRQTAQVLLSAPDGSPVLAAWQYGLGRSLAWTSDFTGRWAAQWVEWEEFPRLAAQLVSWTLPTPQAQGLSLQAGSSGGELTLTAQAQDEGGEPRAGLELSAVLLGAGEDSGGEVELREVRPGEYRATVRDRPSGAYLVQLIATDADGRPVGSLTAGAVVPLSAEYRSQTADPGLLAELAAITGGRVDLPPSAAFDPNAGARGAVREIGLPLLWLALLLLPLDVAVRRLLLDREQVAELLRRIGLARLAERMGLDQPPGVRAAEHAQSVETPPPLRPPSPADSWRVLGDRSSSREEELERLREAQEQARRRLRGEE
ncbi:MAG: hypothetical protein RLZZ387_4347 [Chloroflexota bacterium]|jgi:uncharacterized membrane protein